MSPPSRTPQYRLAAAEAWWATQAYKGSTWALVLAGAVGFAAALPIAGLWSPGTPRLRLPTPPDVEFGIPFSSLAWGPATTLWAALVSLGKVVAGLGVAVWGVVALTVLAVAAMRASARRQEIVVRRAVGASRASLRWAGGLEGLAMSVAAAALGGAVGTAVWHWLTATWPGSVAPGHGWLPAGLGLACAGCILLGAYLPVMWMPRPLPVPRRRVLSQGFVVPIMQLGVALTILLFAGALQRQAIRMVASSGAGGAASGTVFELRLREPVPERAGRYASLLHTLNGDASLGMVSLSSTGVVFGTNPVDFVTTDCGRCSQGTLRIRFRTVPATLGAISADTFRAMGARLVAGRGFVGTDSWGTPLVAIVNASLAAMHFESGQAVGRKILLGSGGDQRWFTVVGVVADLAPHGLGGGFQPPFAVYVSALQQPPRAADLIIRPSGGGHRDVMADVETTARAVLGRDGAVAGRATEASRRLRGAAPARWFGRVAQGEGLVVLLAAILGVFVVMELWVTALLPELALRRAVGARRLHVAGYVLARAAGVAVGGVALGLWLTLMTWGMVEGAFGTIGNPDPGLVLRNALLLSAAALAGACLPAWRSARAAPAPGLAKLAP